MLRSIIYGLLGWHRWHVWLTDEGWVSRRYHDGRWEYRIPKVEDVVEAEYMRAIK